MNLRNTSDQRVEKITENVKAVFELLCQPVVEFVFPKEHL